jgi:hypothetical protein
MPFTRTKQQFPLFQKMMRSRSGSVDSIDLQLYSSDPYPLWVGIILTMSTLGGDKLLYEIITTVFHEVQFNMIPKNSYGPRDCFL